MTSAGGAAGADAPHTWPWRQPIARRRFLQAGAATALGGVVATGCGSSSSRHVAAAPAAVTVNGDALAVGADPDDVSFAWQLPDSRRGAQQRAYRIVVDHLDPPVRRVWDSGTVDSARQAFVAYRGAALEGASRYAVRVAAATDGEAMGPWSEPVAFVTGLRTGDWRAHWLEPGPAEPVLESHTYLRTSARLPAGSIAWAVAYVAGAHKYQLWVNGERVDTGPSFCFPDEQYYQATDLQSSLVPGRANALGFLHHWYGPGRGRPTSQSGLLAQIVVAYRGGRRVVITTDGTWRTAPGQWLPAPQRNTDAGDFVEWIDGRLEPIGWSTAGFDDSAWAPARVLGPVGTHPFTGLYAQRTRIVESAVGPTAVRTFPTGSVVVDFGKVYAARPVVSFRHGRAGRSVSMHAGYELDDDGHVSVTHGVQQTDLSFTYIQREGAQTFDSFTFLGFRYFEIEDPGEPLAAGQVEAVTRHCSMPLRSALSWRSSDPTLDAVHDLCAHSGLFSSHEQFVDTPTREKGQFLWDAANESETVMHAFADQNLSWQGLRDMARAQHRYWPSGSTNEIYPNDDGAQDYPTFTARYPEWVWRYYLMTGDIATVERLATPLQRLAGFLWSTVSSNGLLSGLPHPSNGDPQYGYDSDTVADTTLNILAVNAFRRIGEVLDLVGDSAAASLETNRAASVQRAVNGRMRNGEGLYVDGLRADGSQSSHASQLANASALAYGVAPPEGVGRIGAFVAGADISVQPDHGLELLRALHAAGRDHDVLRVLTDASFPGWARILRDGGTFTWESWTPSDLFGDSMSHGWASSALVAMEEVLLGVTRLVPPAAGAGALLQVDAPGSGPTALGGSVWTVSGPVAVRWKRQAHDLELGLELPANARARVRLPAKSARNVRIDGGPLERSSGVTLESTSAGFVDALVAAGSYNFEVRG